jgi:CBS domain-containing protein
MSVGKICQREVDFADPEEPVFRAAERMRDRTVGALVVLNKDRQPIAGSGRVLRFRCTSLGLDRCDFRAAGSGWRFVPFRLANSPR